MNEWMKERKNKTICGVIYLGEDVSLKKKSTKMCRETWWGVGWRGAGSTRTGAGNAQRAHWHGMAWHRARWGGGVFLCWFPLWMRSVSLLLLLLLLPVVLFLFLFYFEVSALNPFQSCGGWKLCLAMMPRSRVAGLSVGTNCNTRS